MAKDPRRIISLLASAGPAPESLFVRAQFPALFPPHFPHHFLATQINALRMHPFPVEQDLLRTAGSRKNPCFESKTGNPHTRHRFGGTASTTMKSAQTALGSRRPQCLDYLVR